MPKLLDAEHAHVYSYIPQSEMKTMDAIRILDVVALVEDIPAEGLRRGEVGTAVAQWADRVYEVQFSDDTSAAYAFVALRADQLMPLYYRKKEAA